MAVPSIARRRRRRRCAPNGPPRACSCAGQHPRGRSGGEAEAALIVARRLAIGDLRSMLSRVIVIVAPLYNADGNESASASTIARSSSARSGGVGTRARTPTASTLNRDFMKLEATESRAAREAAERLGSAPGDRPAHHERLMPRLSPDLRANARRRRRPADRVVHARHAPWRRHAHHGRPRLAHVLLWQLHARGGSLDASRSACRVPEAARRPGARSMQGRGSSPTASALSESHQRALRGVRYLSFQRRVEVTEAFVETLLEAAWSGAGPRSSSCSRTSIATPPRPAAAARSGRSERRARADAARGRGSDSWSATSRRGSTRARAVR
mgnify:CR=1 FL=1